MRNEGTLCGLRRPQTPSAMVTAMCRRRLSLPRFRDFDPMDPLHETPCFHHPSRKPARIPAILTARKTLRRTWSDQW